MIFKKIVTSHVKIESVAFIRMMRAAYWSSDLRTMTKVIKITRRASSCEAHRGGLPLRCHCFATNICWRFFYGWNWNAVHSFSTNFKSTLALQFCTLQCKVQIRRKLSAQIIHRLVHSVSLAPRWSFCLDTIKDKPNLRIQHPRL